jgi:hypothetical protein
MMVERPGNDSRRELVFDLDGPASTDPQVSDGVRVMHALLHDSDPKVRYYAVQQLGRFNESGRPALKELRAATADSSDVMDGVTVGDAAIEAIRRIEAAIGG